MEYLSLQLSNNSRQEERRRQRAGERGEKGNER